MSDRPDIPRLVGDLIRFGTIERVDVAEATCRVRIGALVTGDVPWLSARAGSVRSWSPPTIGEQCVLLCGEGDVECGVALLGLFSNANPAPSALDHLELVTFADNATIGYDSQAHKLYATLPEGGTIDIRAIGGVKITGNATIDADLEVTGNLRVRGKVTIDDDVEVSGTVNASDDVIAAGKSLKGHKHLGVQPGSGVSGMPQ